MKPWIRHWAAWVWSGAPDTITRPSVAPGFESWTATFAPDVWGKPKGQKTAIRQCLANNKKLIVTQI